MCAGAVFAHCMLLLSEARKKVLGDSKRTHKIGFVIFGTMRLGPDKRMKEGSE